MSARGRTAKPSGERAGGRGEAGGGTVAQPGARGGTAERGGARWHARGGATNRGGARGAVAVVPFALFLALFAPVALLRYLSLAVLIAILLAYLHSALVPRFISVERSRVAARGSRFQELTAELVVSSRFPLPLAPVRIADSVGPLHADRTIFHETLPARGSTRIALTLRSHERGEFALGPVLVSGTDPLGLFTWWRSFDAPATVIIYPVVYRIELVDSVGLVGGNLKSVRPYHEDPTRYRSVREYASGDELKRINWKATARIGKLLTTEYDRALTSPVRILLNLCRADFPERRRELLVERAVETAASLAVSYARRGQPVGLVTAATGEAQPATLAIPERPGWAHAEELLEALARVRPIEGTLAPVVMTQAANVPPGARLLYVGPDLSDEQLRIAVALRRRGVALEHVKVISATEPERNRELSGLLGVTIVEEVGRDILRS